ncbi:MAG TPA: hypothetical protein VK461_10215 [Acidimicrobiales bacterium]|nr:hypothetical protein [Acidimicrobiales bacterium]
MTDVKRANGATAIIGGVIAFYAVFDALTVGLPILVLAARYSSLTVFAIAAVAVFALNVACCTWVDDNWGAWMAGSGARLESKLERVRTSKRLSKPVGWIRSGSAVTYALAAGVMNAILVVATARVVTGRAVGAARLRTASLSYALLFAGVFSACGYALGRVIRAL